MFDILRYDTDARTLISPGYISLLREALALSSRIDAGVFILRAVSTDASHASSSF